jgi:hypothetical protein
VSHWWQHDIVDAGKLPLLLCFAAIAFGVGTSLVMDEFAMILHLVAG